MYWEKLYQRYRHQALCVDIETTRWNGPIAILGIYQPKEGVIDVTQLVRGVSLSRESVKELFAHAGLLITFNGDEFDLPRLRQEFPGCIPEGIPTLDLFSIARDLNLKGGLKQLEARFQISRPEWMERRRRIAVRLWKLYQDRNNLKALQALLEYNAQDAINLYPLAEKLVNLSLKRRKIEEALEMTLRERSDLSL